MPHGITQCYLPPGRGDLPAFTPAVAGTRFTDPEKMQGWVHSSKDAQPVPKAVAVGMTQLAAVCFERGSSHAHRSRTR